MRILLLLGILMSFAACTEEPATPEKETAAPTQEVYDPIAPGIDAVLELNGSWMDTIQSDTSTFYENWALGGDGLPAGTGYVLAGEDTVFIEQLSISFINEEFLYNVRTGAANSQLVSFLLMPSGPDTLRFYNNVNDFPQEILYAKQGDGWHVHVSNDKGRELEFHLVPVVENDPA